MRLIDLAEFCSAIHQLLELNTCFKIIRGRRGYSFGLLAPSEIVGFAQSVLAFTTDFLMETAIMDFTALTEEEIEVVISVCRFIEKFVKKYRKMPLLKSLRSIIKEIETNGLILSLGGKVIGNDLQGDVLKFLKINDFHKKALRLRLEIHSAWDRGILIPVEVSGGVFYQVPFHEMRQVAVKDRLGRVIGYQFFYGKYLLFQTNKQLRLWSYYSLLADGIVLYHPRKSLNLYRTVKLSFEDVKHQNSIVFELYGKNKRLAILLKREDGSLFSIGVEKKRLCSPAPNFFSNRLPTSKIEIFCSLQDLTEIKKKIEEAKFFLSASRSEWDLAQIVAKALHWPEPSRKPLVFRNHLLSMATCLFVFLKHAFFERRLDSYKLSEIFKRPKEVYCLDIEAFEAIVRLKQKEAL